MALYVTPFTCNIVSWAKELCIAGYRIWISGYDAGIHTLYNALAAAVLLPELDVPSRYLLPIRLTWRHSTTSSSGSALDRRDSTMWRRWLFAWTEWRCLQPRFSRAVRSVTLVTMNRVSPKFTEIFITEVCSLELP